MTQHFTETFWRSWPSLDCVSTIQVKGCILKDCIMLPTRSPDKAAPPIDLDWGEDERCSVSMVQCDHLDIAHNSQNIPPLFCPKERRMRDHSLPKETILLVTSPHTQSPEDAPRWNIYYAWKCLQSLSWVGAWESLSSAVSFLSPCPQRCLAPPRGAGSTQERSRQ